MRRFKVLALLLAMVLQVLLVVPAHAEPPNLTITYNGHPISFDVQPIIVNDRSMVPFRAILEKMGATVGWDGDTRTVTADRRGTAIKLVIDNPVAYVNGQPHTLDAAPLIHNDRTLIPLRFVSEQLGNKVAWDADTRTANIVDDTYPRRGGTVSLAMWSAPKGKFNPIMVDTLYDGFVSGLVFDGLWYMDDSLRPQPSLARYWDISDDNLSFTFHLRKNVKWHDGTPFTAADVRFTFESIMHPDYKGPHNSGFEALQGYEAFHNGEAAHVAGIVTSDDDTITFQLKQAEAPFFINNTGFGILPAHLYRDVPLADFGTANDPHNASPVGTGAFIATDFVDGQYYSLQANSEYHLGAPYVQGIIWKVREQQVGLLELESGELDAADVQPADLETAEEIPGIAINEFPQLGYQYIGFNTQAEPFDDRRVRAAAAWAIDRRALIDDLAQGHAAPLFSPIHPLTWAYSDQYGGFGYNWDQSDRLKQAGALLDEAGWVLGSDSLRHRNGKTLRIELTYPKGNKVRENSAPVIAHWLKEAGFDVKLSQMEFATLADKVFTQRDFQVTLMGWSLAFDPDPRGIFSKAQIGEDKYNPYQWYTDESEKLMEHAVRTLDIDERAGYYAQWQEIFASELPLLPLYAMNNIYGVNQRLQDFRPHPASDYSLWNAAEWWISE